MVELALNQLTEHGVVSLDEERTASMVSNLMVGAVRRPATVADRERRFALFVSERRQVLLRIDPGGPRFADPLGRRRVPKASTPK